MPAKRCTANGQPGWKWGDQGFCYTGPEARRKAEEQGAAIEAKKDKKET